MIVILTGAKKNIGDYLIGSRSRKLLSKFVDEEIVELDRFQEQEENLELINSSRAVILAGGPAYAENIYPGIYPLVKDIDTIKVPIVPFGLGWCGRPFGHPELFKFDRQSKEFLDNVHARVKFSSCRDEITHSVLGQQGYHNVKMTGCPVWYDLDSIGKELCVNPIKRIVFTTPAAPALFKQNYILMKELKAQFPEAELVCSFHRGILPDRYTSVRYGAVYASMALSAKLLGFRVVDTSYDMQNISFYKDFDLHVGYRVHAHLDFLSRRKPSVLINEDGRGLGMVRSLKLPELNYNDPDLVANYKKVLRDYKNADVENLSDAVSVIESTFLEMKEFLLGI